MDDNTQLRDLTGDDKEVKALLRHFIQTHPGLSLDDIFKRHESHKHVYLVENAKVVTQVY